MDNLYEEIIKQLEDNNNVLIYKENLYEEYAKINQKYNAIYISTPKKGKTAFEQILKKVDKM